MGSSLEFVTFKLKEHWNVFLLIKIYSAKFTSIKNIVCSKQPYSQSLPWVSEVVSIILTWQSGLPGYSCREAPPSLLPSCPRRPCRKCCDERLFRENNACIFLPSLRYLMSGREDLKVGFWPEVSMKIKTSFVCILCVCVFFTHSKHACLAQSLWILGSQLVTTYIGKWLSVCEGRHSQKGSEMKGPKYI